MEFRGKTSHGLGFGSWKSEEAGSRETVSDTFMSPVTIRNYTGEELRLHILGFVPFIPGTLEVDQKVNKVCFSETLEWGNETV